MALKKVLIAYVSASGATDGIAHRIAADCIAYGAKPSLLDISKNPQVKNYDAVIFGCGIRIGKWHKEGMDWLLSQKDYLVSTPFAVYSVGLKPATDDPNQHKQALSELQTNVDQLAPAKPLAQTVFAGWKNPEGFSKMESLQLKMYPIDYGDYRDWNVIDRWVKEIAPKLFA